MVRNLCQKNKKEGGKIGNLNEEKGEEALCLMLV